MPRGRRDPALTQIVQRNCRAFRAELGEDVSQEDVAILAGVSLSTIARFEQGEGQPAPETLRKLADAFGRRLDDFYNPAPPRPDVARRKYLPIVKWIGTPPEALRALVDREVNAIVRRYEKKQRRAPDKQDKPPKSKTSK